MQIALRKTAEYLPTPNMKEENKLIWASAFTFANTMMGCAILSLPYAFSRMGWVIGLVVLSLVLAF